MLILATDMARHGEILEVFKSYAEDGDFDLNDKSQLDSVGMPFFEVGTISSQRYWVNATRILLAFILLAPGNSVSLWRNLLHL